MFLTGLEFVRNDCAIKAVRSSGLISFNRLNHEWSKIGATAHMQYWLM